MDQQGLSETYLRAKRYLTFFAAILVLTTAVGLTPKEQNSLLGWSVANPQATGFVIFVIVLYYLSQLALFWDAQGKSIRELAQHSVDYRLSVSISLLALYSLPLTLILRRLGVWSFASNADAQVSWPWIVALLVSPIAGWLAYRGVFRPSIRKSREAAAQRELDVLSVLTSYSWELVYNPIVYAQTNGNAASKEITFRPDGEIRDGRNINEHTWRINAGFLEILNNTGKVFSRFRYDPAKSEFRLTNDEDLLSIRDQFMIQRGKLYWADHPPP